MLMEILAQRNLAFITSPNIMLEYPHPSTAQFRALKLENGEYVLLNTVRIQNVSTG